MRLVRLWGLSFLCQILLGHQAATAGPIKTVAVKHLGGPPIESAFVLAHLVSKIGDEYDSYRVTRDVEALYKTHRFSYVGVEMLPGDRSKGVGLIYHVHTRMILKGSPTLKGNKKFRDGKVQDLLNLTNGDFIDDASVALRAAVIRDEYRKKLYPDATVVGEMTVVDEDAGFATLRFTIKEGRRVKVGDVVFEGNTVFTDSDLRPSIKTKRLLNPFSWFSRQPYEEEKLQLGLDAIRDKYQNVGYLDVVVSPPVPTRREEGTATDLAISINEGRAYEFGEVDIRNVTLFPNIEIEDLVTFQPGDVAAMDALRRSRTAIQLFYGNRGYINADARPVLSADEKTGLVDVKFMIREGDLVKIRNVYIRGNTVTRDKVVRRELGIFPGDDYHLQKVKQSENNIRRLGFFSTVVSFDERLPDAQQRDLIFRVEEKQTGQFMVGAGFSSIDKVVGYMEFQQGNFDLFGWPPTGGGQKLKLSLSTGSTRNEYSLSFIEPWFLNERRSLGVDLFRRELKYPDYDAKRTGVKFRYTVPLSWGDNNRVTASYRLQQVEVTDVADTNEYFLADGESFYFSEEQNELQSTVGLGFTHDTRDNYFVPTDGSRVRINGDLTGGPFGGEANFMELRFDANRFIPVWGGHVVSFRGQYHVIDPFGDTEEVSILDRYYLGGGKSLRGFEWRDVGPKAFRIDDGASDEVIHRPVGGQTRAVASAEYTIPVSDGLRFAVFIDAGNVYEDSFASDFSEYAASAGVGVRLDVPGFPIRLDLATDLRKDDEFTETDTWSFNIGF